MADQLIYDYRTAELLPEDQALCDYAVKLTRTPGDMNQSDVLRLSDHGFTDEQITIGAQVVGYFNYINRIADGLGVEPEDWMQVSYSEWLQNKAHDYA